MMCRPLFLLLALAVATSSAYAASKRGEHQAPVAVSTTSDEAPHARASASPRFGVGFSNWENISTIAGAITGIVELNNQLLIQPLFGINTTTGSFYFAAGALAKYTVHDMGSAGFHVGGGAVFGNVPGKGGGSAFGVGIPAVGGFHFSVPGASRIVAHLDGGPQLTIVDGDASFALKALSPAFGLSVVYMF